MPVPSSLQLRDVLLAAARREGLTAAAEHFPDDVVAAAEAAARARIALAAPEPVAEPWPPMRTGAPG